MAAVVGPMAAGAMGGATGGMVASGAITAETAAGVSAATGAVAAGAASKATVSVVNNRGSLGAVFKDVTSSNAIKGYAVAGATAGLTATYFDGWTGTETDYATGQITSAPLNTWSGVGQFAANQTLQNGTSMLLGKALGQGGSGSDALKSALFNTLAAVSFNAVGDYTNNRLTEGYPPKIMVHAMVGGLLAEATGGDFRTGALAAGLNEAAVGYLNTLVRGDKTLLSMSSQVVGVMAAASRGDADASSIEKGGWVAKNATQYNHMLHQSQTQALDEQRQRHPEKADRLNAAACALTRCAESIPTDDPQYSQWKAFQDRGETYQEEVALLEGTGQFDGRSFIDWSDDQFGAYGNAVQKIGAARDTAVGLVGGAGGYGGMIATSPACVGIVTCTVPAALGTLGTLSLQDAWESAKGITADFQSSEPQRVADSFQLGTFPGDESATTELLKDAAIVGAGATALGAAERAYRKIAGGFTSGAKATGTAREVAGTGARNPLLDDAIPRGGDRLIVDQGPMPTCGHNSCGMVLNTLGKEVNIDTLIQKLPPSEKGIFAQDVASLMKSEGIPASAFGGRNVADLARYTSSGTPVVARIIDKTTGSGFSHFVVVDGVTIRSGISVVAVRDPHGKQYFSPVNTFERNFSGEVVVPRSALK